MYTSTLEKFECKLLFTRVTRGTGASSSAVSSSSDFASSLGSVFYVFGIVSFVTTTPDTTTPDKIQVQNPVGLSQINVIIPTRLNFKLYAVIFESGSRIDFLFMRRQDIVNYWDFPSKISRNGHKRLVLKITRHG